MTSAVYCGLKVTNQKTSMLVTVLIQNNTEIVNLCLKNVLHSNSVAVINDLQFQLRYLELIRMRTGSILSCDVVHMFT